jgi:hypothetical protein
MKDYSEEVSICSKSQREFDALMDSGMFTPRQIAGARQLRSALMSKRSGVGRDLRSRIEKIARQKFNEAFVSGDMKN